MPPPELSGNPVVDIENYQAVLIPGLSDTKTGLYAYAYQDSDDAYLQGNIAQKIPARQVRLPGLQILEQQDAISTVHMTQNEYVGGKINKPFVYETPMVSFGNPLHPTISTAQPINIATLDTANGLPAQRSLNQQLTALFAALFKDGFSGVTTIQLDVAYGYAFAKGLNQMMVEIPVAVLPPMDVTVADPGGDTAPPPISAMVATVSAAIEDWSTAYKPSAQSAKLGFNLTIMSNLTENPMPLLNLMKLELDVSDIVPPLPNLI